MTGLLADITAALARQLSFASRGPKRNGVFALWLLVNTCDSIVGNSTIQSKNHRKRVAALKKRLSSLSLPFQLRQAVPGAIQRLDESATPRAAVRTLDVLIAPAREALGHDFGELISWASRTAAGPSAEKAVLTPDPNRLN